MASACFFARCVSVPAHLLANPTPLAITTCGLRRLGAAGARPVCAAGRMLGSVRYGTGAALGPKEADAEVAAVPPSVPVRVAYELQLAGHRYLDVRTEGEFGGGHPAGAVKLPLVSCDHRKKYMGPMLARSVIVNHLVQRKRDGEKLGFSRASVGDIQERGRDHHRMPEWQEISHGSSRTLLRWLQWRDRHRRRVFCLEGERAADQPVTSSTSLNVSETLHVLILDPRHHDSALNKC
ncbi:uncharacterized protein LOC119341016 [Triticum dicoccoides]|uniref:uncharacterized protein LOC119341016 n=1 Tax=Triticum dicoccoides TaxID=85692 RepID=UPI00189108E8|nr:uncharacterized protein LOC119341016 [Triticum dicoccoides]